MPSNIELRPLIGSRLLPSSGTILLVCFYDPNGIPTIWEGIRLLQKHSRYSFSVLNLWPGRGTYLTIPSSVDLKRFDGVFIHPTVSYNFDNVNYLDAKLATSFENYEGLKILAKQDENYHTARFDNYICAKRFDLVLSCVPEAERLKAYPRAVRQGVRFLQTLTAYVSEDMQNFPSLPYGSRPIDLSYRGSLQPPSFGRLGFEKWNIGERVKKHPSVAKLRVDISSRAEDRIHGSKWLEFLASSKAVLGVESGSDLFDFDGSVEQQCNTFRKNNASLDVYSEEYYEKLNSEVLDRYEGNVNYAQISPRHFEAASCRCLQILYEGDYSGIFKPNRHFFPLKRDLSNLEEAVELLLDEKRASLMIEAAHEEIVCNDNYTYRNFVGHFDDALDDLRQKLQSSNAVRSSNPAAHRSKRFLNLCPHDPDLDPRIQWHSLSLKKLGSVVELGTYKLKSQGKGQSLEQIDADYHRIRVESVKHRNIWEHPELQSSPASLLYQNTLALLNQYSKASFGELTEYLGAFDANEAEVARFQYLCGYFVEINSALLQAALYLGPFDCIVCADLESLPAAVALKGLWGSTLVFDSHEFWPFSDVKFRAWESEFWSRLEARLVSYADMAVTVSDPLAEVLEKEYGQPFFTLPNATRAVEAPAPAEVEAARARRRSRETTDFLFQGGFAEGRGLDLLIDAWTRVPPNARLFLRGPHNEVRQEMIERARRNGTLNRTVFFPEAVAESELMKAALEADVGIIPYDPSHYAYRFACPNKLSQYMAAGIPILTNKIEYVANIVSENDVGVMADFSDPIALVSAIDGLAHDKSKLADLGRRAREYFETEFNWEKRSAELYERIDAIPAKFDRVDFDFARIRNEPLFRKIELGDLWETVSQNPIGSGESLLSRLRRQARSQLLFGLQ